MKQREGAKALSRAEQLQRLAIRAGEDPDVLAVLLFGSMGRSDVTPASDVDVCLVLQPQAGERTSAKRLEYLAEFELDIQVFQQLPLYLRQRVLHEAQVLLCKDEAALYELAYRTVQAFEDFQHIYYDYLEAVLHARP